MSGYKKYPHVPCRSIHLKLDRMLAYLERHCDSAECEAVIEELKKVIAYRGNVLSIQKRRKGFTGEYLTVTREKTAEPERIESVNHTKS